MLKLSHLIFVAALLAGGIVFLKQLSNIKESHSALHEQEMRLEAMRGESTLLGRDIATLNHAINEQGRALTSARTVLALEEKETVEKDPETLWASPPPLLPDWQPDSPYIWLSKEMVAKLPWEAFGREGDLTSELATILTLDGKEVAEVSRAARTILQEYRSMESQHVRPSTNHLAGISGAAGAKYTIEVQPAPEEGARLRDQFAAQLVDALGEGRAEFVQHEAGSWISNELSDFGAKLRTISVAYVRPGYYQVAVKSGSGSRSTGGDFEALSRYIPPHLMGHFEHLRAENIAAAPAAD